MQKKTKSDPKFHSFEQPINDVTLPEKFTYPFHYIPHPLCIRAAGELQNFLKTQQQWQKELEAGKMFGVLVVRDASSEIGFLSAFSGMLDNKNLHDYFVPPIYDLQQSDGFFKPEEAKISAINKLIELQENDAFYLKCRETLRKGQKIANEVLEIAKTALVADKEKRNLLRKNAPDATVLLQLARESQYQKASLKRLKQHWFQRLSKLETRLNIFKNQIEQLKTERKKRSAILQRKLFEQFILLNAKGEERNLCDIFKESGSEMPPAGAGECAAPKLLQYAYNNHFQPLAMAEFWWGSSPKSEIRRHGHYYPACKEKCEPILTHMLQGLKVEENLLLSESPNQVTVLYEDEWLAVVNKPTGLLSVPGKYNQPSVYQQFKSSHPEATGPLLVHRLDMATSGLLLIAKTKEIHKKLQAQFCQHTIKKRYIALVDGIITSTSGTIELPICPDPHDRPRQVVNYEYGKPAFTEYQVIEYRDHQTLIAFYPQTGRTHQLRVHAAHPQGLDHPIAGDKLYGRPADRLYLHAEQLEFQHPVTGKNICLKKEAEF